MCLGLHVEQSVLSSTRSSSCIGSFNCWVTRNPCTLHFYTEENTANKMLLTQNCQAIRAATVLNMSFDGSRENSGGCFSELV